MQSCTFVTLHGSWSAMSIDGSFNSCHIALCGRALFCKRSHYEFTLCIKYLLRYKGKHSFFLVARKNVCLGRSDRRTKGQWEMIVNGPHTRCVRAHQAALVNVSAFVYCLLEWCGLNFWNVTFTYVNMYIILRKTLF